MKKLNVFLLILVFLALLCSYGGSKDIAIGVSPGTLELGTLERGSTELVNFYVVTPSEDTILVYLDKGRGNFDFFNKDKYKGMALNYSEEDTTPWLKILNNPVELKNADESLEFLRGDVRGHRNVNLILNIPDNADPGYHLLTVIPSPVTGREAGGQVGTQMVAVSPVRVFFNIPGKAIREGKILDISTGRRILDNLEMNVHFLNSGTVTISASATKISIMDKEGNVIKTLKSNLEYVKPGEIKVLKAYLPIEGIEYGTYDVFADVGYTTGSTQLSSTIILKPEPIKKVTGEVPKPQFQFKWWMIAIVIIMIILIYRWLRK